METRSTFVWRWFAVILAGSTFCTLGDQVHVRTGVLAYREPGWSGQSWWVPLVFVFATLGAMATWRVLAAISPAVATDLRQGPRDVWGRREVIAAAIWMALVYGSSGFVQDLPRLAFAAYVGLFMLRAWALDAPGVTAHALVFAVGGTAFEAAFSSTGAFWYIRPDQGGVPVWLPGLYLHGTFLARAVLRRWPLW